jgi:outer membrane protein OmpA-like peptidoglycan-associated protein
MAASGAGSRPALLVLALIVVWAVGSGWWYTCRVKEVCAPRQSFTTLAAASMKAVNAPPAAQPQSASASGEAAPTVDAPIFVVYFGRKSTDIIVPPGAEAVLADLQARAAQGRTLLIVGHSDARGAASLKAQLSAQRAVILRDWLVAHGVPAATDAVLESHEDREPVADNATAKGRAQNRRAVATLLP